MNRFGLLPLHIAIWSGMLLLAACASGVAVPSAKVEKPIRGYLPDIYEIKYNPDGKSILTLHDDNIARVWDASNGKLLAVLSGHTKRVSTVAFSPDGKRILSAGSDKTARIWDVATGEELARLMGHEEAVVTARYNPEGTRVVTASFDGTARVWDAATGKELFILSGHAPDWVYSATFSPDGKQIVTAGKDGTARIWDAATGKQAIVLMGHTGYVYTAEYSPDGKHIVTASLDGTARVWDAATGSELSTLKHNGSVENAIYSPGGSQILTLPIVHVWDAESGKELFNLDKEAGHSINSITYSPDGTQILRALGRGNAMILDARTGKQVAGAPVNDFVTAVDFSPDGRRIATDSSNRHAVIVWDAATWAEVLVLGTDAAEETQVQAAQAARRATASAARAETAIAQSNSTPAATALPIHAKATAQAYQSLLETSAHWRVLLSDSFDASAHGWTTGSYKTEISEIARSIGSGTYRWEIKSKQVSALTLDLPTDLPDESLTDFAASVVGRQISGTPNSRYGLVFRYDRNSRSYFVFDIAADGSFKFSKGSGEYPGKPLMAGKSSAIRPGESNRVTVIGQGSHFTFFVNGEYVAEADDTRLNGGSMGPAVELINAGDAAIFEFNHFEVRAP